MVWIGEPQTQAMSQVPDQPAAVTAPEREAGDRPPESAPAEPSALPRPVPAVPSLGADKPPLPIDADAYHADLRVLAAQAGDHCEDAAVLVRLADLHALRPAGGPDGPWRMLKAMRQIYDPDAAVCCLERAQRLAPDNAEIAARLRAARVAAAAPMLLAALPKSGSVFLFHGMTTGTGKGRISGIQGGAFPNFTISQSGMIFLLSYRLATHTHLAPSRTNLIELGARFRLDRMVVHVRDPRQALVSWYYFMSAVLRDLEPSQGLHYEVPADYLAWPQHRQLDWQIERMLPWFVDWIAGWLDASAYPHFTTRILFTTFEDMVADTKNFFDRILEFYEIDRAGFTYPEPPRVHGDRNFRRGEVDEWRRLLAPDQVERVSAAIPAPMFDRFGWPRR